MKQLSMKKSFLTRKIAFRLVPDGPIVSLVFFLGFPYLNGRNNIHQD